MKKLLASALAAATMALASLTGAGAANDAHVRVLHGSPDAPAVDVYANGNRVLSNVPFKGASDYLAVPPGSYTFEVRAAGSPATSEPVLSATTDLRANTAYTVAAVDRLAEIKARVFVDNIAPPVAGKAHVQVLHASPDAPAVDIAVKGGPVLVSDLPFGEQKGPLPVEAGTYNLEVRPTGTTTVVLPLDGVRLEAGKVYTFAAVGLASGSPALSVQPLVYTPAPVAMMAPRAGDGGLLDRSRASDSGSYLPWAAGAAGLALVGLLGARFLAVRSRR